MSKATKKVRSTAKSMERTVLHKIIDFVAPHFVGSAIFVIGMAFHFMWGDENSPNAARFYAPFLLLAVFGGLAYLAWRYSAARPLLQRLHVVGCVSWSGLMIVLLDVFGWHVGLMQLVLVSWFFLALSLNLRRLTIIRGDGDEKEKEGEEEIFGIKRPRSSEIVSQNADVTVVRTRLAPGDIADQVTKVSRRLGSRAGTIPNGVRVIESEDVEGELELKYIWRDLLAGTFNYPGPRNVGGSITDPVYFGVNEEGQEVYFIFGPVYDKGEFIPPGHLKVAGRPRSGKGVLVLILFPEICSRRNVFPMVSDHAKGEQMLSMLRPGLPREKTWINTTQNGVKAQGNAILRAMRARNKALGKAGYSSWRPEAFDDPNLRMPALVWFVEEFTSAVRANPQMFTDIANEALSAGIYVIASMQRISHSEMPTSMRSAMANGICFKTEDAIDDEFVLSDETLSTGTRPSAWPEKTTGRFMCSLVGTGDRMNKIPGKTYFANSLEDFESYIPEVMGSLSGMRPELDPVTRAAFGSAFEEYVSGAGTDPIDAPDSPAPTPAPASREATYDPDSTIIIDRDEMEDAVFTDDEIPDEEEYVIPKNEEINIISTTINPREDLFPADGPNIDLSDGLPKSTKKWTRAEKESAFAALVVENAGRERVTTMDLVERWCEMLGFPEANQRATLNDFLRKAAEEGIVTRHARGKWTFPVRTPAHPGSPVNGTRR